MGINGAPRPARAETQKRKSADDQGMRGIRQNIVIEVVVLHRRRGVHPGQDRVDIQKSPPGEQQGKIEIAEAYAQLPTFTVWAQGQSRDHRNAAEKKDDVAGEKGRDLFVQVDFV